jgi:hypothetical protein
LRGISGQKISSGETEVTRYHLQVVCEVKMTFSVKTDVTR